MKSLIKNKSSLHLLFILLLISPTYAFQGSLLLNLTTQSSLRIIPTKENHKIDNLQLNLSLVPQNNFQQRIIYFETFPDAGLRENNLVYLLEDPKDTFFGHKSQIRVRNNQIEITKKVPYPFQDKLFEEFKKPSPTIDAHNPDIVALASQIAQGQDDLFEIVTLLSSWTNQNINYSLSTLTADVSQNASWVLQKRQGVCDELTSLFIALNRALGIPARFVTGLVYTNIPEIEDWGPHGWAEIYFPHYGWVPFDPTFDQHGFVDSTHIKLAHSLDPAREQLKAEWFGYNTEIEINPLQFNVDLISSDNQKLEQFFLNVTAEKKAVGFHSYNLIKSKVNNLKDSYRATTLYLSLPPEIYNFDQKKTIILQPFEEKELYWLVKVKDLDQDFSYSIPFSIYNQYNISSQGYFNISADKKTYSLQEIGINKSEKAFSPIIDFEIHCPERSFFFNSKNHTFCSIKNKGNIIIKNLSICIEDCQQLTFHLNEYKNISLPVNTTRLGHSTTNLTLNINNQTIHHQYDYFVQKEPSFIKKIINFLRQLFS